MEKAEKLSFQTPTNNLHQWGFDSFVDSAIEEGFFFDLLTTQKPVGPTIQCGEQTLVNFASINILNTHREKDVMEHFQQAADHYGLVTGGSRVTQGISEAHMNMEETLCRITGKERALSFASGLLANIGFVNAMSSQFKFSPTCTIDNRDTIFILDRDSHWSLWKAVSHLKFGRQVFAFRHNDAGDLRNLLNKLTGTASKIVVIFESIYSADGSIAPMGELLDICDEFNALSYVDDANGFMIYGPHYRPFSKEYAEMRRATFVMVSFSKAIGLEGGAIAGPDKLIHGFEVLSGTSLFTAAIQPPTASTIDYLMNKLEKKPQIMNEYLHRSTALRNELASLGCRLNETPSYIISVLIGKDEKAVRVWQEFRRMGFSVPMFRYPAVKSNHALLRIMLNNHHSKIQIRSFINAMQIVKKKYAL